MNRTGLRLRWSANPHRAPADSLAAPALDPAAREFHRRLPGYLPTPLLSLPGLARDLGIGAVMLKDESRRFGLNAFKVLGAAYAVERWIRTHCRPGGPPAGAITFTTATDGNHGRALAWAARRRGQNSAVFVPASIAPARLINIGREGAEVVVADGDYDEAVRLAKQESAAHGWTLISDTSWPGYEEIPPWIVEGYTTLFAEVDEARDEAGLSELDIVFVQGGVGSLAWAAVRYYCRAEAPRPPLLVVVEPVEADCLLESITSPKGELRSTQGSQNTIMAGLNCGTPSFLAWPWLRSGADLFLAVDDDFAVAAMRRLARPLAGDPPVVAGEAGAAGLAGLMALCTEGEMVGARSALGLSARSAVLVINTEGDTDPENYARLVE